MTCPGDYRRTALEKFGDGFNCAQAVLFAFSGDTGMDRELALKIASGFGAGLGRKQELCGAVSGAVMVLSLIYGSCGNSPGEQNSAVYSKVQEFIRLWREAKGSIICLDLLKGHAQTENRDITKRPCGSLVALSCELIEKIFSGETSRLPEAPKHDTP